MKSIKKIVTLLLSFVLLCGMVVSTTAMTTPVQAATTVKLNKTKATVYVGNTVELKLNGVSSGKVTWASSDTKIATVSSKGLVTAKKKGTVTITATYKEKAYNCTVKVKSASISEKSLTIQVGRGYTLDVNNTEGKVTWKSSDTKIAKVNENGFISPLKEGNVTVSAKVGSETYTCKLKIVSPLNVTDFNFDWEDKDGYVNFIDYQNAKGSYSHAYFDNATETYISNRNVNVGDTFDDVIEAFGCQEYEVSQIYTNDAYRSYFINSAYPNYYIEYSYTDQITGKSYHKRFYFDKNNSLVLIIWCR
jgi:uncharacterized protein YjdB